jgi:polysaccharide export outer membrane protein
VEPVTIKPCLRSVLAIVLGVAVAAVSIASGPTGRPVTSVTGQQALSEYTLNPGDTVEVTVLGQTDLTRSVTIRPDGKINMPLIGDIEAVGLTPTQLADRIAAALKAYLRSPQVTVSVRDYQRAYVYLIGQVSRTGSVEIQRGWTIIEVMSVAGGPTPRAALRKSSLIRRATGQVIALDLDRLLTRGDRTVNVSVEPGDIIMIPQMQNRVLILGSVRGPGAHDLDEGTNLIQGLAAAGGPVERAGVNRIGIIRNGPDGKAVVTQYDMNRILRGDMTQNPTLRDGDIVYVPQGPLVRWQEVLAWLTSLSLLRSISTGGG